MIENILIKNYKSIRDLQIELKPLNILIGSNGVGKNNFISFFQLANSISEQRLQSFILERGIDNLLHFGRKKSDEISGLIDFNNTNAFFFSIKPTQTNKAYIYQLGDYFNTRETNNKDYKTWHKKIWETGVEETNLKNRWEGRAKYLKTYLESFKVYHFHDTSVNSKMKIPCKLSDNRILREDGSNLAAFLFYLKNKHEKNYKKIEAVIRSIAPFFEHFDLHPDRNKDNEIQLEWKEKNSDMYFNAHNLSDGTLRVIALTTLLLQPHPPKTIIIDEPELGLHPFAINKLAGLIRSASVNNQVIISTQSINLVSNFEPENLIVVDREDNQSTFKRLNTDELKSWLEEYSLGDLWEKNIIGGQR